MLSKSLITRVKVIARAACLLVLLVSGPSAPAFAVSTLLELNPTGASWGTNSGNVLSGRGIYLRADENFTVDSIGLFIDVVDPGEYQMQIREGNGVAAAAGSILAAEVIDLALSEYTWQDVRLSFDFQETQEYVVTLVRSDLGKNWSSQFDFQTWGPPDSAEIGPLTLLEGRIQNGNGTFHANWLPNYRLGVVSNSAPAVPEPGTAVLMAFGLLVALRFSRHRA